MPILRVSDSTVLLPLSHNEYEERKHEEAASRLYVAPC
jgi:hypothetical protein